MSSQRCPPAGTWPTAPGSCRGTPRPHRTRPSNPEVPETLRSALSLLALGAVLLPGESAAPNRARPWGEYGHRIAAEAAAARLPREMPAFFRDEREQLVYLSSEPDRWREEHFPQMREGFRYDHYINLERMPLEARSARDRWSFLQALNAAGIASPHLEVGFLPFRILELYQRLESGFARWRTEADGDRRAWIERRIMNDAGILGHYVTDASNPHHATIHFNGWDEAGALNPGGFTTDRGFHARFESRFIASHVRPEAVARELPGAPAEIPDVHRAVWALIDDSSSQVRRLYELEVDVGFEPDSPPDPAALRFSVERLAAGARLLADLWWSAWTRSGGPDSGASLSAPVREAPSAILVSVDGLHEAVGADCLWLALARAGAPVAGHDPTQAWVPPGYRDLAGSAGDEARARREEAARLLGVDVEVSRIGR